MGRNGNAPSLFARTNTRACPVAGLLLTFVVGMMLFLPFPSWQQLVGFITSATVISFGSGPLVRGGVAPGAARPRARRTGSAAATSSRSLAFYSANMIVYWAGWTMNKKLFITVLIGYMVLVVFQLVGDRKLKPSLDFKSGAIWVMPWFVRMALISWLFDPKTHPAMFGWVFLINAAVSVFIYYLALYARLPVEKVQHYIAEAEHESEEEEEMAGGHIA